MSERPLLIDLFCKAGGAGMGYHRAGFEVIGVDIEPQPNYPFRFEQADALDWLREELTLAPELRAAAYHASPPCQGYSRMRHLPWLRGRTYPLLIDPVRELLQATGRPWIIENVEDAPLRNSVVLCGTQFGLKLYRHRRFEGSLQLVAPPHEKHREVIGGKTFNSRQRANANGWVSTPSKGDRAVAEAAMGIDWMTRAELSQAIPPAYTEYLGRQLLAHLSAERAA